MNGNDLAKYRIDESEFTQLQAKRFKAKDQPVVSLHDVNSRLAKRRRKHQRYLARKRATQEANRRAGN